MLHRIERDLRWYIRGFLVACSPIFIIEDITGSTGNHCVKLSKSKLYKKGTKHISRRKGKIKGNAPSSYLQLGETLKEVANKESSLLKLDETKRVLENAMPSRQKLDKTTNVIDTHMLPRPKLDETTKVSDNDMPSRLKLDEATKVTNNYLPSCSKPKTPKLMELEEVITATSIEYNNQEILDIQTAGHTMTNFSLMNKQGLMENSLLEEVITATSIDYNNQEILDIQTAVHTMMSKVVSRMNKQGKFEISRIQPCGSMVEKTAIWKYEDETEEIYTEFDFLAILANSPEIIRLDRGCGQCVGVSELPAHANALSEYQSIPCCYYDREMCGRLFRKELNTCLGSDCDCFSVHCTETWRCFSYKLAEKCDTDYLCDKCVVEMPTGILRVNDSASGSRLGEENCSVVFCWTSKANKLVVCGKMLKEEALRISSLRVRVDFLPALEVLKAKAGKATCENDFFLVPKPCIVCGNNEHWRKSNCFAEIDHILNEMSEKHRKCYKILKFFFSTVIDKFHINCYYIKTVSLNHSRTCSDSSDACAECVDKMLTELGHAYETKTLNSFSDFGFNIFSAYGAKIFTVERVRLPDSMPYYPSTMTDDDVTALRLAMNIS